MPLNDLEIMIQRLTRGSVSVGDWETLAHFALDKELVVELGTNIGTTSIMLSSIAKRVITIDIFENIHLIEDRKQREVYATSFEHNQHFYSKISQKLRPFQIETHQGLSWEFAQRFNRESVDMVFVDADHTKKGVSLDYNAWFPIVKSGGYFAFHDIKEGFQVFEFYNDVLLKDDRIELQEFKPIGISTTKVFWKR